MTLVPHKSVLRSTCLPKLLSALSTGAEVEIVTVENHSFTVKMPVCEDGIFPVEGIPVEIGPRTTTLHLDPSNGEVCLRWSIDVVAIRSQAQTVENRQKALKRYFGHTANQVRHRQAVAAKFAFLKASLDIIADEFNDYEK